MKRDPPIPEGQAISARWRSLTHSYLPHPPLLSAAIVQHVSDIIYSTGSFPSTQPSTEFVKKVALGGIETIIRLAERLESTFMVDVASSDMSLIFEIPRTAFNRTRMANEFGSDRASTSGKRDKVAGTLEVGVEKSICGGRGEARRTEVLLKVKVVLEKDVAEL